MSYSKRHIWEMFNSTHKIIQIAKDVLNNQTKPEILTHFKTQFCILSEQSWIVFLLLFRHEKAPKHLEESYADI